MKRLSIVFLCLLFICIPVFADDAKLPCGIEFGMTPEQVSDILKEYNLEKVVDDLYMPFEPLNTGDILYTLDDSGLTVPCSMIMTQFDKGLIKIDFTLMADVQSAIFSRYYIEYYEQRQYLSVKCKAIRAGTSIYLSFELR